MQLSEREREHMQLSASWSRLPKKQGLAHTLLLTISVCIVAHPVTWSDMTVCNGYGRKVVKKRPFMALRSPIFSCVSIEKSHNPQGSTKWGDSMSQGSLSFLL